MNHNYCFVLLRVKQQRVMFLVEGFDGKWTMRSKQFAVTFTADCLLQTADY